MEKVTVYCLVSGCTPEVVDLLQRQLRTETYGRVLTQALRDLADAHEVCSQNDLSVIGPMHPSGEPFPGSPVVLDVDSIDASGSNLDICPEKDVRVLPHCVMGEGWDIGVVEGPFPNNMDWDYFVASDHLFMVQTHTLDLMALATDGRMTPLRLWKLGMQEEYHPTRIYLFRSVNYGEIEGECDPTPLPFPGMKGMRLRYLENFSDVELVKQRLVHEGKFWIWMAPDRFPVLPAPHDPPAPLLRKVCLCKTHSALERLPMDILIYLTSHLPLASLVNLASTSCLLRTNIFGNDYLASAWLRTSAPWWVPAPTRTPRIIDSQKPPTTAILPYPATQSSPLAQNAERYPGATGLDWAYVRRCARSGSMLNRRRIWKTVLDIERVADMAGV